MSEPPPPAPPAPPTLLRDLVDDELATCRCGHDRYHVMVSPEPEYTAWATFWITVMGVSATPLRIRFRCRVCRALFDATSDPAELKKFI